MKYIVNREVLSYSASNETEKGKDIVLLDHAIDITAGTPWAQSGFTISPLYSGQELERFETETRSLLISLWQKAGLDIDDSFALEKYHEVANTRNIHLQAVEQTKLIDCTEFPGGLKKLEARISALCGLELEVLNPFDQQSVFHFRVIRPMSGDNNPLHRDVWLEDYRDCINLYIPVVGSNERSSLVIAPGSHRWPESKVERTIQGAEINTVRFNVPAVTHIDGEIEFTRPNPDRNEVLIFSPYLIHGGATNLNANTTRISIEIRLWKKSRVA